MKLRPTILLLLLALCTLVVVGQTDNANEKRWSSLDRLNESDFQMHVEGSKHNPCFAQFSINYSVSGFDFMTKNFNQKVDCVMFRSASWINSDVADKSRVIYYQQVLFDISELYSRKFRKALLTNRKKIAHGTEFVEELNRKVMQGFTEERAKFERESEGGLNEEVMETWSRRISGEITELELYSYDYTRKIKLAKK